VLFYVVRLFTLFPRFHSFWVPHTYLRSTYRLRFAFTISHYRFLRSAAVLPAPLPTFRATSLRAFYEYLFCSRLPLFVLCRFYRLLMVGTVGTRCLPPAPAVTLSAVVTLRCVITTTVVLPFPTVYRSGPTTTTTVSTCSTVPPSLFCFSSCYVPVLFVPTLLLPLRSGCRSFTVLPATCLRFTTFYRLPRYVRFYVCRYDSCTLPDSAPFTALRYRYHTLPACVTCRSAVDACHTFTPAAWISYRSFLPLPFRSRSTLRFGVLFVYVLLRFYVVLPFYVTLFYLPAVSALFCGVLHHRSFVVTLLR